MNEIKDCPDNGACLNEALIEDLRAELAAAQQKIASMEAEREEREYNLTCRALGTTPEGRAFLAKLAAANERAMPTIVAELKVRHKRTWRNQPAAVWMAGLWEEVAELCLALDGQHQHSPDFELSQIAAIAINWIEHRAEQKALEG